MSSAVFKWPDADEVLDAARRWARDLLERDTDVAKIGAIGSYARGDWGVGSDLDLLVILRQTTLPPLERYCRYCPSGLPVAADVLVYTEAEWASLAEDSPMAYKRLLREVVWLAEARG